MKYKYIFGRLEKEITKIRKEKRLSQEELAFESNVDRSSLSLIEKGKLNPTLKTLFKICFSLRIKPSDLFIKINR